MMQGVLEHGWQAPDTLRDCWLPLRGVAVAAEVVAGGHYGPVDGIGIAFCKWARHQLFALGCREDMLKRELADITRRGQAAEARHEDLASALPEATRPLLRQIEAMQASQAAHSQAWAAAEHSLHERLSSAEAQAAVSGVCISSCLDL